MARAEAAKKAQADFLQIKHKPVDKSSKQAKAAHAIAQGVVNESKLASRGSVLAKGTNVARNDAKPGSKSTSQVPEKKKTPVDLGYKGTMRAVPSKPEYKGIIRGNSNVKSVATTTRPTAQNPTVKAPGTQGRYRYANYSDEDEDEEEDGYEDESDMEAAGFDDLMDEEEQSLRQARKEDEEALKEENALRRAKQKKLEELAARRKK